MELGYISFQLSGVMSGEILFKLPGDENQSENQIKFNFIPTLIKTIYTRSNPYPPKFNKIPAKIIEPLDAR